MCRIYSASLNNWDFLKKLFCHFLKVAATYGIFFFFFFGKVSPSWCFVYKIQCKKKKIFDLKIQGQDQFWIYISNQRVIYDNHGINFFFSFCTLVLPSSFISASDYEGSCKIRNERIVTDVSRFWNRSKLNDKRALCEGVAYKQERDLWDPLSNKRISYGVARSNVFQVHASCAIDAFRDAYKLQIARSGIREIRRNEFILSVIV